MCHDLYNGRIVHYIHEMTRRYLLLHEKKSLVVTSSCKHFSSRQTEYGYFDLTYSFPRQQHWSRNPEGSTDVQFFLISGFDCSQENISSLLKTIHCDFSCGHCHSSSNTYLMPLFSDLFIISIFWVLIGSTSKCGHSVVHLLLNVFVRGKAITCFYCFEIRVEWQLF